MLYTKDTLRKLQSTQIEILDIVDGFCSKHNIQYSLYAGTLIGAVRHKGFIPWDDDLDICMTRYNYDLFIENWIKEPVDGYILQNKDIDNSFTQSFTKIRKDNTCFLQNGEKNVKYHTGIFIDIFPIDRLPKSNFKKILFKWRCMKYQLYTREFIPPNENVMIKMGSFILLLLTKNREKIRRKLLNKIISFDNDETCEMVGIETMKSLNNSYPSSLMNEYLMLEFNGKKYPCVREWDVMLKTQYGDYMKLPPIEEREWKHHPAVIDFNHNYNEINSE